MERTLAIIAVAVSLLALRNAMSGVGLAALNPAAPGLTMAVYSAGAVHVAEMDKTGAITYATYNGGNLSAWTIE